MPDLDLWLLMDAFLVSMCVLYLWLLVAAATTSGALAAKDRLHLASTTLEAVLVLLLARFLVPWSLVTQWVWIAFAGVLGAGVVLVALRWRALAWVGGRTGARLRWRRVTAPAYAALLLVVTGLAVATVV